jgi:peptide/nickel transport system permease protein
MLHYIVRRVIGAGLVLVVVSALTFVLLDLAPGDAAELLAGDEGSAEYVEAVRQELGLNMPLATRYLDFMGGALFRGDLGESYISGRPVSGMVADRFGYTLTLALVSMTLAIVIGTFTGMVAAARPGGYLDLAVMGLVLLGQALPTFWVALLLILVFGLHLGWLPIVGSGDLAHLVMPALALALPATAVIARLVRASLLDVKHADYVCTARSKGLGNVIVWRRHMLRNSLVPVVTLVGLHLGQMLGGAFIIETIFGWPGLGRLMVQAIFDRDLPVVVGSVLLIALIVVIVNLLVDLAHAWIDPRVGQEAV